jgi:hypothetical protein
MSLVVSPNTYVPGATARRGKEIYEQSLRQLLEPAHRGEYLILNVETGAYEIVPDMDALSTRLYELGPSTSRYLTRIGFPGLFHRTSR